MHEGADALRSVPGMSSMDPDARGAESIPGVPLAAAFKAPCQPPSIPGVPVHDSMPRGGEVVFKQKLKYARSIAERAGHEQHGSRIVQSPCRPHRFRVPLAAASAPLSSTIKAEPASLARSAGPRAIPKSSQADAKNGTANSSGSGTNSTERQSASAPKQSPNLESERAPIPPQRE